MTKEELKEAMKDAMKKKEPVKLNVIRGLLAAITNEAISKGRGPEGALSEEETMTVLARAARQRRDSIEQFEKGGHPELAASEKEELLIIERILPAQMPREEIEKIDRAKAAELGISDKTGSGKLMSALMKDLKGKADGAVVKEIVDSLFV